MKETSKLLFILFFMFSQKGQSQNPKVYRTDEINKSYAYVNVIKTYERIAEKGYKSIDLFQKLGNSFYADLNMEKAAKWYGELFTLTSDLDPIYYDQYANALYTIGQKEKANYILEKLKLNSKNIKN